MKKFCAMAFYLIFMYLNVFAEQPIILKKQGSFFVGGKSIKIEGKYDSKKWGRPQGQTRHGDHAYVFFQIPEKSRRYPVVFLHGASQSGKSWETTPDGRDGFQNIFLRHGYSTYILDRPRCGRAGLCLYSAKVGVANVDQLCFDIFRFGLWPNYYKNVQFPTDENSLKQFFCQTTPNIGGYDKKLIADTVSKLFDKVGEGILITHSQGCESGWYTAINNRKVRAIIAIEPASGFVFPEGECPGTIVSSSGFLRTSSIAKSEFVKLTRIPIIMYYGDNIPDHPTDLQGQDNWYQRLKMARLWAKTINKYGGNAKVVHLPEVGIYGNTHFMFMDKNNKQIADLIFKFLKKYNLDK